MANFSKKTSISNFTDGKHIFLMLNGHVNLDSCINKARAKGAVGQINIEYCVFDNNGRGRGGHDGKFKIDANNNITKVADWKEFGTEHSN